jgi:hypothetical protein
MSLVNASWLAAATAIFLVAASTGKMWAVGTYGRPLLILTLVLYTLGNLIMLRLIREVGMAAAFSLSAVGQLIAVNIVALAFFGERISVVQGVGIVLAILSIALITLWPAR